MNDRDLASIERINSIVSIANKDRIELATISGWEVIIEKGTYKEGDLVVYVEYDTVLPVRSEFEFLRSRCYSKLYNGFRIRNMKMAGVFSQGIVFPLSILPSSIKIKEGLNVSEELGIVKYDPTLLKSQRNILQKPRKGLAKWLMKFKWYKKIVSRKAVSKDYPSTISKSNETNIQKIFGKIDNNIDFYVTEKLEGQSFTACLLGKKKKFHVYSHNIEVAHNDDNNWSKIVNKFDLENKLNKFNCNYAIQGEIIGEGIQKNIYNIEGLDLYIFKVVDTNTGRALNYETLIEFCNLLDLKMVPILEDYVKKPDSIAEAMEYSNGRSVLYNVKREGVVYRSMSNQEIGFKVRSPKYLQWWDSNDKTE